MFNGCPHTVFTVQHFIRCDIVVVGGGDDLQSLTNLSSLRSIEINWHC